MAHPPSGPSLPTPLHGTPAEAEPCGWARMVWQPDHAHGGWVIPTRLAGGDVLEFGTHHAGDDRRWYGIVDCYDAVEWLTVQGPYPAPEDGDDQASAVRQIAASTNAVSVLVGPAGMGKTFTLDTVGDVFESAGYQVVGAAPSARAAIELTGEPASPPRDLRLGTGRLPQTHRRTTRQRPALVRRHHRTPRRRHRRPRRSHPLDPRPLAPHRRVRRDRPCSRSSDPAA